MNLKKTYPWNVLVFPAASEVGLEINRALGDSKEAVLHGAMQPGPSIAGFHYRHVHELPPISDAACLPVLQKLIVDQQIDAVFPAYDDVTVWLAERAEELGAAVVTSPLGACLTCRSKSKTYATLKDVVATPRLWAADAQDIAFPIFVKPDKGQGSQRARRIDTASGFKAALAAEPDLIVMEHLPGREYTVDCFSQRGRGVLYAGARARLQTKTGISTLTRMEDMPAAREWAESIGKRLDMRGAWFFQVKEDAKGELRLLEVAPRIAGSMALSRVTGLNFPLMSLYEAAGHSITVEAFDSRMVMGRSLDIRFAYDGVIDALYLDLDHTLILNDKVNPQLMALIFQCRNRGIPVRLLTRHKGDLDTTLDGFRLAHVFDQIVHISSDAKPKADYIKEKNAVFIDDSFQERQDVARRCGIRCFDAAAAVCLLDERR